MMTNLKTSKYNTYQKKQKNKKPHMLTPMAATYINKEEWDRGINISKRV